MKKIFPLLALALVFAVSSTFAQNYKDMSVNQLEKLKNEAVANENYAEAAKYKKAIELHKELEAALKKEDYEKAAEIKKKLEGGNLTQSGNTSTASNNGGDLNNSEFDLDFYNTAYILNKENNEVISLEKQTAEIKTSSYSAVFVAGSSSYWVVDGESSPVQISDEKPYTFLVKVAKGIDPSTLFKLARLELLGKDGDLDRSLLSFKTTAAAYAGASTQQNDDNEINISFKKIDDEVYEVLVNEVLPPSEYAFIFGTNWFLFGNRSLFTNNPEVSVKDYNMTEFIYDQKGKYPKSAWLGIDYSLANILTDEMSASEDEIKNSMKIAATEVYDRNIKHGKLEAWLRKEEQGIYFNPAYTVSKAAEDIQNKNVVSQQQNYTLTDEDITRLIESYNLNHPGVGLVIIPEAFNLRERTATGYAVWFGFGNRKIVHKYPIEIRSAVNTKASIGGFIDDFVQMVKVYIDDDHIPKLRSR